MWRETGRAYLIAVCLGLGAAALHWLIVPIAGARTPFAFFLIAIGAASFVAGRGPALVVLAIGVMNGVLLLDPQGSFAIAASKDRAAIAVYALIGLCVLYAGYRIRRLSFKSKQDERALEHATGELLGKVADLQQLHDLSANLVQIPDLPTQLRLILESLIDFHSAAKGLVSLYDPSSGYLRVIASVGFSDGALQQLRSVRSGTGACGTACEEKRRVVVLDTEQEPRFENFRELARQEGFRAVHSTPMLNHNGDVIGALSVHLDAPRQPTEREIHLADICARKAAVFAERSRAELLAEESEHRFRVVLDASAVPFCVLGVVRDTSGTIVDFSWRYVNEAATRILQHPAERLVGRKVLEVLPQTWEEPGMFDAYVAAVERKETREFEVNSTTNGIIGWFHVVASPLDDGIAVWFADISERKRHEHELRVADKRKDEFLATLAHELRNPLAPIRQAAMVIKKSGVTEAQRTWCQDVIDRQVQNMSLLLDDLLDVSRITRGVLQLRKQSTSLADIVESGAETARHLVEGKRHTLKIDVPAVRILVDPLRMSQIVSNLLTNAAKYSNPEGIIQVSASIQHSDLVLDVADSGIGLTQDQCSSIFKMFSQVESAEERSEGGLGIGLALTRGLVQLHGGSISAASEGLGKGSTFSIRLPNVVIPGETDTTTARRGAPALVLSRKILLADDNRDAAESLAMLLRADGHDVTVVHDGKSALAAFDSLRPDIALLDIGMPGMSGFEVARRIREDHSVDGALLVAISGWGKRSDVSRAHQVGFDHHLTKPLEYAQLTALLAPKSQLQASG